METKAMPKQEFNYLNFVFTTIPAGWVGGWPGGWLEKVELRLSQLSTKIEIEVDLKLSLAIQANLFELELGMILAKY